MPFIIKEDREELKDRQPSTPGERCYLVYKQLVTEWHKEPRWTNADKLYRRFVLNYALSYMEEYKSAANLAWQVFFVKYVMPYEEQKLLENGDVLPDR